MNRKGKSKVASRSSQCNTSTAAGKKEIEERRLRKLKVYLRSVAYTSSENLFNFSTLNDLYQDSILPDEFPCDTASNSRRYNTCAPTAFLIACCFNRRYPVNTRKRTGNYTRGKMEVRRDQTCTSSVVSSNYKGESSVSNEGYQPTAKICHTNVDGAGKLPISNNFTKDGKKPTNTRIDVPKIVVTIIRNRDVGPSSSTAGTSVKVINADKCTSEPVRLCGDVGPSSSTAGTSVKVINADKCTSEPTLQKSESLTEISTLINTDLGKATLDKTSPRQVYFEKCVPEVIESKQNCEENLNNLDTVSVQRITSEQPTQDVTTTPSTGQQLEPAVVIPARKDYEKREQKIQSATEAKGSECAEDANKNGEKDKLGHISLKNDVDCRRAGLSSSDQPHQEDQTLHGGNTYSISLADQGNAAVSLAATRKSERSLTLSALTPTSNVASNHTSSGSGEEKTCRRGAKSGHGPKQHFHNSCENNIHTRLRSRAELKQPVYEQRITRGRGKEKYKN